MAAIENLKRRSIYLTAGLIFLGLSLAALAMPFVLHLTGVALIVLLVIAGILLVGALRLFWWAVTRADQPMKAHEFVRGLLEALLDLVFWT